MIKLIHIFLTFFILLNLDIGLLVAKKVNLDLPLRENSLESMVANPLGVLFESSHIRIISSKNNRLGVQRIHKKNSLIEPFAGSERIEMEGLEANGEKYLLPFRDGHFLLFEAKSLRMSLYSLKGQLSARHSIPYDLILPPLDRGGEAPEWEKRELRDRFKRSYINAPDPRIVGISPVPKSWIRSPDRLYFLLSQIEHFPLLLMACSHDIPSQCRLERVCFLEGLRVDRLERAGIALQENSRSILIASKNHNQIDVHQFKSCFHSYRLGQMTYPSRIGQAVNIAFDSFGSLWLMTKAPDDYFNASLFRWESKNLPKW